MAQYQSTWARRGVQRRAAKGETLGLTHDISGEQPEQASLVFVSLVPLSTPAPLNWIREQAACMFWDES